jgi:hypothetical protein
LIVVLSKGGLKVNKFFFFFFRKNDPVTILCFLDESTTLKQELSIFCTVDILSFIKAIISTVIRSVKRMLKSGRKTNTTINPLCKPVKTEQYMVASFTTTKAV